MNNDENNSEMKVKDEKGKQKRMRSPYLFPAYDFGTANLIASKVELDGGGTLSEESLAMALRMSVKSSGFQLKALTARQFGLLIKQGNTLLTTPRAKAIIKPTTEDEKRKALVDSFLELPLFREVATRYKGTPLPQGQAFRNILEREFGIPSKRVTDAERVLIDTARQTGVLVDSGGNYYLSTETKIMPTKDKQQIEKENDEQIDSSEDGKLGRPIISVQIESKDFVSMEPEKITAFFDGLSKIIGKEEQ
jgi:hypothetical protein